MSSQFKVVGIMGRTVNPRVIETLDALIHYLRDLGQQFLVDAETAIALSDHALPTIERNDIAKHCHLLIVVGGDGSLLHAARTIVDHEIPILGINRGRLGFLTDINPNKLEKIKSILEGDYLLEKRFLLTATTHYQGEQLDKSMALNEVALIPNSTPHMSEFEIYINDQFVCSQESDGIIIATPTGSTAYALSGGGPILHPQLDALVLVPMFPHTLSMRPIVIEGNNSITLSVSPTNTVAPRLACDGQESTNIPPGSRITISKKEKQLHLIHPRDYDYYESLRSKLHWGRKLHYSES